MRSAERQMSHRTRCAALALLWSGLVVLGAFLLSTDAAAGWLSRLGRIAEEAGGAGGSALRHVHPSDDLASGLARHLKALPPAEAKGAALAVHATPEGHWRFANRDGDVFTAANAAEVERAFATLLPEGAGAGPMKLRLYLSEATVFERSAALKELPPRSELYLLANDGRAFRLAPSSKAPTGFAAEVRRNVRVELSNERAFDEAMFQLGRPLKRASVRVVSLEPGARHTLPGVPRIDPATKAAMVDAIDPWKLSAAVSSIKGQTLVLVGRVEGSLLHFKTGGALKAIDLDEVRAAAKAADVDVVVLQASNAVQPGGSNWLWQTVEVKGLGDALQRNNFGDFLDALGNGRGGLAVDVDLTTPGRALLDVVPAGAHAEPLTGTIGNWASDIAADVLGNVVMEAVKVDAVDRERRRELDDRIIPGIPSVVQWTYIAGLVLGVIGLGYAADWWRRIWPLEQRSEYAGAGGYYAARAVRILIFWLVFLPLVGIPAGLAELIFGALRMVWNVVTAPFRFLRWLAGGQRPAGG